jgi:hypothetical protein
MSDQHEHSDDQNNPEASPEVTDQEQTQESVTIDNETANVESDKTN